MENNVCIYIYVGHPTSIYWICRKSMGNPWEIYGHGTYVWEIYKKYMTPYLYTGYVGNINGKHLRNLWLYTKDINCVYVYIYMETYSNNLS